MSQVFVPGPAIMPRPAFPKCPTAGAAKAFTLYQPFTVGLETAGLPTTSGRMDISGRFAPVVYAVPVGSGTAMVGVRNWPVEKIAMAPICQPPANRFSARGALVNHLRCVPKGNS